jgi:hypothetical protein
MKYSEGLPLRQIYTRAQRKEDTSYPALVASVAMQVNQGLVRYRQGCPFSFAWRGLFFALVIR